MQSDDLNDELDALIQKMKENNIDAFEVIERNFKSNSSFKNMQSYLTKFLNENYLSILGDINDELKNELLAELNEINVIIDNKIDFSLVVSKAMNTLCECLNSGEIHELKDAFCSFNNFIKYNKFDHFREYSHFLARAYNLPIPPDDTLLALSKAFSKNIRHEDVDVTQNLSTYLDVIVSNFPYVIADAAHEMSISQFQSTGYANKKIERVVNIANTLKASSGGKKKAENQVKQEAHIKEQAIQMYRDQHPTLNRSWKSRNEFVSYFLGIENSKRNLNDLISDATVKRWIKESLNE